MNDFLSIPPGFSRRRFLGSSALAAAGAFAVQPAWVSAEVVLPRGSAPAPVGFPHFPDRLHAFVWRNWPLVPVERMAAVVGAAASDISAMGKSMGLPEAAPAADGLKRGALTIIRRNWHLLPYDQLLALLGWTAEELDFTLREDDFFFIKLGSLKPDCAPLRWAAPTPGAVAHAARIAGVVRVEFPESAALCGKDPLFSFVGKISTLPAGDPAQAASAPPVADGKPEPLRLCYSYFGLYGDPLLEPELDPYPDGLLARLRESGVNAVWLPAVLSKLSPLPWDEKQSEGFEKRRENLKSLTVRARRFGISIMLYLNEPRLQPVSFFKGREGLRGVAYGDFAGLCTSVPEVRAWLSSAIEGICRAVPDLGGFFTITASENNTNCWSHGRGGDCPRCRGRTAAEVIAEVIGSFAQGIVQAGGKQRLVAWDWGWGDWAEQAIAKLPPQAELMSVSEWSVPITRGGIASEVGEYSLSARGPGPRALRHWKAARDRGLRVIAKVQAGLSWEFSAAPWLPVVQQAAAHARALKAAGVEDLMLGWTLGGYPSPNFEALDGGPEAAARRRAGDRAPALLAFWDQCSRAVQEFPFHIGVVYQAPLQFGPANLLWSDPTGFKAAMVGLAYDDLESWRAIYPADVFIAQLEKTAAGFLTAVEQGRAAFPDAPEMVRQEFDFAETAALHWQSVAAQSRYISTRTAPAPEAGAAAPKPETAALLKQEIAAAKRLYALQSADSRIGFEASNQYYYTPLDLVEKVLCCRHLLERDAAPAGTGK